MKRRPSRRPWLVSALLGASLLALLAVALFGPSALERDGAAPRPAGSPGRPVPSTEPEVLAEGEIETAALRAPPSAPLPAAAAADGVSAGLAPAGASVGLAPAGESVGLASPVSHPAGDVAPALGGLVADARTGEPVPGARVRATLFHATGVPEGELLGIAGTPPFEAEALESGPDGTFVLRAAAPDDPRALLHVQVEHPGRAPFSGVLAGRAGADGVWSRLLLPEGEPDSAWLYPGVTAEGDVAWRLEVRLRRSALVPVRIIDPRGGGLADAPVRVTPWREGHAFLEEGDIRLGASRRLVSPGEPRVLFTDGAGVLDLPFSDAPYDLELLHPLYHLRRSDPLRREMSRGRVRIDLPFGGEVDVPAVAGVAARHRLLDLDGRPLARAEIEVALDGSPPVRLVTDDGGRFALGLLPRPPHEPPLGVSAPRRGRLTVLSPDGLGRRLAVELPSAQEDLILGARPANRLRLRLVEEGEGEEVSAVMPRGIVTTLDMVPLRYGADGVLEFAGELPEPEEEFLLLARGHRPALIRMPAGDERPPGIDLGDIRLEKGWSRELRLVSRDDALLSEGAEAAFGGALAGAVLSVAPEEEPLLAQRYPVAPEEAGVARVTVAGLSGGLWSASLESPGGRPFSTVFTLHETALDEPLVIDVDRSPYEEVRVAGRVLDILPRDAARSVVVERYRVRGREEPLVFPPYPLSPDGAFGTIRRLEHRVEEVRVAVIGPDRRGAERAMPRHGSRAVFPLGELRLARWPRAAIDFEVAGLGKVLPPLRVSLEGERGVEAVSRIALGWGALLVDNLRLGRYTLAWRTPEGKEETFPFVVESRHGGDIEGTARRSALEEELVEVAVADGRGEPIEGARVTGRPVPGTFGGLPSPPGRVLAPVTPRATSRFTIAAEGYLDARVTVEAGEVVPTEVTLYRPVTVEARVVDADGLEARGAVEITWAPPEGAAIRHGEPVVAPLAAGRMRATGLPPLERRFTFRLAGSEALLRLELSLPEEGEVYDLGTLRVEETRTLLGSVRLPGGAPARDATVLLLPRARAYRFPLEDEVDPGTVSYRTRTGAQGSFRLESLPLDLPGDLVLVARLDGYGDAHEDPVDWELRSRELRLRRETVLAFDVGYRRGGGFEHYRFTLEYREDPNDPERVRNLGELVPELHGFHHFTGVEPGHYRVRWDLREGYSPFPGIWEDVFLPPEGSARISLRIDGRLLEGTARLNGEPVERGWVLLTESPGENGGTRVGRIQNGAFTVVDPPAGFRAWAAVIPERAPQPLQNIARGEALPVDVAGYHQALRAGRLDLDYRARDLTVRIAPGFLERYPGATLHYERHHFDGRRFVTEDGSERIESPVVRFHLLRPGIHRFSLRTARGSLLRGHAVPLRDEDVVVDVR